jgi:hypothetical protein
MAARDEARDPDAASGAGAAPEVPVPLDAFFRLQVRLPRLDPLPPLDGSLRGWPPEATLPDLAELHDQIAFGRVAVGWSPQGLAFAVAVQLPRSPEVDPEHPFRSDGIEIWIDTRDSRVARRPTRFCHHFLFLAGGRGPQGRPPAIAELNPGGVKRPQDMADLRRIRATLRRGPAERPGYVLEFLLPPEVLTGFAPVEATSIGLGYRLRSPALGVQDLAFGEAFPLWRNPSLWLSAVLGPRP